MASRKIEFANGEYYHVFNRGTDKRDIFLDHHDLNRFLKSLTAFNLLDPIGSIYEQSFSQASEQLSNKKLVNLIAYALHRNHFHLLLHQQEEAGIEKFMHRLGTGFTLYFNTRHRRKGGLFQGTFQAKHIDSNAYLLHLSAYINLNHRVHQLGSLASKLSITSWPEYQKVSPSKDDLCQTSIILEQFQNLADYQSFTEDTLAIILENKEQQKELEEKGDLKAMNIFNHLEAKPPSGQVNDK